MAHPHRPWLDLEGPAAGLIPPSPTDLGRGEGATCTGQTFRGLQHDKHPPQTREDRPHALARWACGKQWELLEETIRARFRASGRFTCRMEGAGSRKEQKNREEMRFVSITMGRHTRQAIRSAEPALTRRTMNSSAVGPIE